MVEGDDSYVLVKEDVVISPALLRGIVLETEIQAATSEAVTMTRNQPCGQGRGLCGNDLMWLSL